MAELSNHSYHYKSSLLTAPRRRQPYKATIAEKLSSDDESGSSKNKKQRRRKRMLTGVSKQRRAANERERRRLNIINLAFKDLKSILPLFHGEENISKIEIVRLATKTISYLSDILNGKGEDKNKKLNRDSPLGSEFTEESLTSEGSSSDRGDMFDVFNEVFDVNNIDISTFLNPSSLDGGIIPSTSLSSGFDGLDLSSVIYQSDDENDVFPSMLYL